MFWKFINQNQISLKALLLLLFKKRLLIYFVLVVQLLWSLNGFNGSVVFEAHTWTSVWPTVITINLILSNIGNNLNTWRKIIPLPQGTGKQKHVAHFDWLSAKRPTSGRSINIIHENPRLWSVSSYLREVCLCGNGGEASPYTCTWRVSIFFFLAFFIS